MNFVGMGCDEPTESQRQNVCEAYCKMEGRKGMCIENVAEKNYCKCFGKL